MPSDFKLLNLRSPMITWSSSSMSSSLPASTRISVTRRSSGEGEGSPDGWLCTMMIEGAFCRIASRYTSPARTTAAPTLPLYTSRTPITWLRVFTIITRRCS
jgi:hypothetical protein